MKIKLFASLLLLFSVVSCQSVSSSTPPATIPSGYPALVSGEQAGYPSPDQGEIPGAGSYLNLKVYPEGELPPTPQVPEPLAGMAAVSGTLFSANARYVVPQTTVYLTPGWGDTQDQVPNVFMGPGTVDIRGRTDDDGQFVFDNVPPGTYYLISSAPPYDWTLGYKNLTPEPLRIDVRAGDRFEAGVVYIYWP